MLCVFAVMQKRPSILLQRATVISTALWRKVCAMSRVVEFLVAKLPKKKNKLASLCCVLFSQICITFLDQLDQSLFFLDAKLLAVNVDNMETTLCCKKVYHPNFDDNFNSSCMIPIIFGTLITE